MKVIGLCGSGRKGGNTALIMRSVFQELEKQGIEVELIELYNKDIDYCKGCFACKGKRNCVFQKDDFNGILNKIITADGILLGSPVYSADVSAKMKTFLDRAGVVVATNPHLLQHKVGASVSAVRRAGGLQAVDAMNHFLLNKEILVVGSTYWNMVYGFNIGEALQDEEGMRNMQNLGQNMAWLLNLISSAQLSHYSSTQNEMV